jgi:hypothetical protein
MIRCLLYSKTTKKIKKSLDKGAYCKIPKRGLRNPIFSKNRISELRKRIGQDRFILIKKPSFWAKT